MRLLILTITFFSSVAFAQTKLDLQAQEMERKLVAPCCWAKTLDQEQSEVAIYMKQKIKQQLALGKSVEDIYAMFEDEFGERVLADPKKTGFNWAAWFFPIILMLVGTGLLVRKVKILSPEEETKQTSEDPNPPSSEDQKYIDQIDQELYRS